MAPAGPEIFERRYTHTLVGAEAAAVFQGVDADANGIGARASACSSAASHPPWVVPRVEQATRAQGSGGAG
jgi:hypothetical protein